MGCCCGTLASITTEVIIDAPINNVWETFIDWENHASWNTFCKVSGEIKLGNYIDMVVLKKDMRFKPLVLALYRTENKCEFRWKGQLGVPGIFDGEHYFIFETLPNDASKTRFIHGEKFTGCLTLTLLCCIDSLLLRETRLGFEELNAGLKVKCETQE